MSERTLKEKTTARCPARGVQEHKAKDMQERGESLKAKLDEVEDLIDEALKENVTEEQVEAEIADGKRCPCGFPLSKCMSLNFDFFDEDFWND